MSEHILIIDDEESVRRSLEMIFEGVGIRARSCPSAEDGLVAIGESSPAVLFLDLQLPGMDGMELLRRLSAEHSRIRVIMISGHATIERAVEATRLGAFDFVPDSPVTLEAGQTYWVYVEPTIQSGCTRWEGDSGAPLEEAELPVLESIFEKIKPFLS